MRINNALIISQYNNNLEKYKALEKFVHYNLDKIIKRNKIKIHSIDHRIKEISSIVDKARRKKIENPLDHFHDLVGFRVVCLFLTDLEKIEKIICDEFEVFERDDKITDTEMNTFGYMSLHLKAYIKPSDSNDPDSSCEFPEKIEKIPFEIQVRTIAQDAWASISHYLDYKKESDIPVQLKKDFYALSGLFYVADTHFSILKKEQSSYLFDKTSNK